MPLPGTAFLALWNDFESTRLEEYETWHATEHVPERVSIPGILAGRRYEAPEAAQHRYFTLYPLENLAVLDSAPYRAVAEKPTPWSASMRPSMRAFNRQPCATILSFGHGVGGWLATLRLRLPRDAEGATGLAMDAKNDPRVSALHLGRIDAGARFPVPNAAPPPDDGMDGYVAIIEAGSRAALDRAVARMIADDAAVSIEAQTYGLINALDRNDVDPSLWRLGRNVP